MVGVASSPCWAKRNPGQPIDPFPGCAALHPGYPREARAGVPSMPRFLAIYTMKPENVVRFRALPKDEQDAVAASGL